ncbi:MAG TPA: PEP/pyruvate-binding domain-containing protein [Candidatus Omnitrophota bacterium]|nr:PEP/pyruvate-binding domain-containing protein [Candidatus Omnitrophota bacterium]
MISSGDKAFDKVITGLQLGDNVVWQIDDINHYIDFVKPFIKKSLEDKRRLVYIRFAQHKPILEKNDAITIYDLDPTVGFESFSSELNSIIKKEGKGVFYIFDCLSDLLSAWSNDLMIGNFFKITCPFLFELDTIAYFSLLRNNHSFKTVARIRDTTQLLIDAYFYGGNYYVHPLKVWNRYSPTMFLPHIKKKNQFVPIANSVDTAKLFSNIFKRGTKSPKRKLDYWDQLFLKAEDLCGQKNTSHEKIKEMMDQICRILIARDEKMVGLAKKYFKLEDFLNVKSKMIGTGFVGGKTAGMLLARAILEKEKSLKTKKLFEPHDSFYVGSDVFYTYIVENGWWKARMEQRTKEGYFEVARQLKEKLLHGTFPEEIKEQFQQMIEYFGQSPIIVRSSSLLEDSYGNAFAGKYDSIFLVNQGTPEERYAQFVHAVRQIYASMMNEDALAYRLQRGLDQMDEQMALLVQRVSGAYHQEYFFPDMAGVGVSYNIFVWNKLLNPKAGMLRLVVGMGTRAVNRVDGDYPRIVALDDPLRKPIADIENAQRFSQHEIDVINVKKNIFETVPLTELLEKNIDLNLILFGTKNETASEILQQMGKAEDAWVITFDNLLSKTPFQKTMQKILSCLEIAYGYPVDIEFTVNVKKTDQLQINLLQCRPLQTKGLGNKVSIPQNLPKEKIIFQSQGNFLGGNISQNINKIIYVDPKAYSLLPTQSDRYEIARAIGEINRGIKNKEETVAMLLGPGRWGTSTPSLGVPVNFAEINHISILGEIAFSTANATPEISFGTHFFQDLVETGIFYLALFPNATHNIINQKFFDDIPKNLKKICPQYSKYNEVIKIFDIKENNLKIMADILSQKMFCFFE